MYILEHPNTNEQFSFERCKSDLSIQVKKDGEDYREDYVSGCYCIKIARKLWNALISQGFEKQ